MTREGRFTRRAAGWATAVCVLAGLSMAAAGCAPTTETPADTGSAGAPAVTPPRMKMTTDIPASILTPPRVETSIGTLEFFDGVPDKPTTEAVYDFVDRARAVEVYINLLPAVSMHAQMEAERQGGAVESHQVLFHEELADSKTRFLTTNNSTLYLWGHMDLEKDGPTVIEAPPGVLGVLDDMYLVEAFQGLGELDGRAALVDLAAGARNEAEARFYRSSVNLLVAAQSDGRELQRAQAYGRAPAALAADGTLIVAAAVDLLIWQEGLMEVVDRPVPAARARALWLTGQLSARAKMELRRRGFEVREGVSATGA